MDSEKIINLQSENSIHMQNNNTNTSMGVIISCPFKIKESNNITKINFKGNNQVIINSFVINDINLFGFKIDKLEIQKSSEDKHKYQLKCTFNPQYCSVDKIEFFDKLSYYITYLLLKEEHSPYYGTNFVEFDLLNLISSDQRPLRDSLVLYRERGFIFTNNDWNNVIDNILLKYYYDGAKAVDLKSKYFNWFLVIEHVEHSNLYKRKFQNDYLFSKDEQISIKSFAKEFKNKSKRSVLINVASKTQKNRTQKLYEVLLEMGINGYRGTVQSFKLNPDIISNILDIRNNLVHEGEKIDETIFWEHYFPIIKAIVDKSVINRKLLD